MSLASRKPGLAAAAVCLLCLALYSARAASVQRGYTTPAALAQAALEAVNASDEATLNSMAAPPANVSFAWVHDRTTRRWRAAVGHLTGFAATYIVFHAWHTCESDGDHVYPLVHAPAGWSFAREIPETAAGAFRVRDHQLTVALDLPQKTAEFTDSVLVQRVAADSGPLILRLSDAYSVSSLNVDGSPVLWVQAGGILLITPPQQQSFHVDLKYGGVVNHSGSDYIRQNEATIDSYWYPTIARLPATTTVTVRTPPGWTGIAQGKLMKQSGLPDGGQELTFHNPIPVSFYTVDMGQYHVTSRPGNGVTLYTYLLSDDPSLANRCLDVLSAAMRFYSAHFAPFPYDRYSVVETQGPFDGALEAYSFATFQSGTLPGVIPHELSHTWWGGLVPCTYTRSMWDESFADYSSEVFDRDQQGAAYNTGPRRGYDGAFDAYTLLAAHDTSNQAQDAVGYGKGALVLHLLEAELTTPVMYRCLQAFAADHHRGDATEWPEFEAAVQKVTGKSWAWFFDEWLTRPGLPSLSIGQVRVRRAAAGYSVTMQILQAGQPYRLQLPIQVETAGGQVVDRIVEVSGPASSVTIPCQGAPQRIVLDPQATIPLRTDSGTVYDIALPGN